MDNGRTFGEVIGINEELLLKSCSIAIEASVAHGSPFIVKKLDPSHVIMAFPSSCSVKDWFSEGTREESNRFKHVFPSLRSIGNDEWARVNPAFLRRFFMILDTPRFQQEVQKAKDEQKKIVFAGHSLGGSIAIFAAIWLLEQRRNPGQRGYAIPLCVTFGAPLVGDKIMGHALQREEWSCHFVHFILKHDIVPRISLSTLPSIEEELNTVLQLLPPNSGRVSVGNSQVTKFFVTVMRNALSVASHSACLAMECNNLLLEAITGIVELSPYRPVGTYVFCAGNGRLVHVKNSEAILQMLFYCLQLGPGEEVAQVAITSLMEHRSYISEVGDRLQMQDVVYLDNFEEIPLSVEVGGDDVNMALRELGLLSMEARLGLRASGELEKQKLRNLIKISSNCQKMEEALQKLETYRTTCRLQEVGYYDAFKLQKHRDDFDANVTRLVLAGIWDEIIEMLKRYELPDGFEVQQRWIELGTHFRRLVEPLDIANYHRHAKNDDTGPYLLKGRPKRYRYTQRWYEWASRMVPGSASESFLWAKVEEMRAYSYADNGRMVTFGEEMKRKVDELEGEVCKWVNKGVLRREDLFAKESTFMKWWMDLPQQHRSVSPIAQLIAVQRT